MLSCRHYCMYHVTQLNLQYRYMVVSCRPLCSLCKSKIRFRHKMGQNCNFMIFSLGDISKFFPFLPISRTKFFLHFTYGPGAHICTWPSLRVSLPSSANKLSWEDRVTRKNTQTYFTKKIK